LPDAGLLRLTRARWHARLRWQPRPRLHTRLRRRTRRTMGFASLGGATLDNEENYLIKKLFTALGAIQIENQARI